MRVAHCGASQLDARSARITRLTDTPSIASGCTMRRFLVWPGIDDATHQRPHVGLIGNEELVWNPTKAARRLSFST